MDAAVVEPSNPAGALRVHASREIWVHADLPVAAVDERAVDRLLGLVVEAVVAVRRLGEPF